MSKGKKRVVSTTSKSSQQPKSTSGKNTRTTKSKKGKEQASSAKRRTASPTRGKKRASSPVFEKAPLLFSKRQFQIMGIGIALIFLGMILMAGGAMPSEDVWDDQIIYSFRRTVLAPIFILAGLVLQVVAIFRS